jgi:hypothetical protein
MARRVEPDIALFALTINQSMAANISAILR